MKPIAPSNSKWQPPSERLNPFTCPPERLAAQMCYLWNTFESTHVPINRNETTYVPCRLINRMADTVDIQAASQFFQKLPYPGSSTTPPPRRIPSAAPAQDTTDTDAEPRSEPDREETRQHVNDDQL